MPFKVYAENKYYRTIAPSFYQLQQATGHLFIWVLMSFSTLYRSWVVLWAEETSTYSWSRFCTVNYQLGKQLSTFPHKVRGLNRQPQRWEASVLPLHWAKGQKLSLKGQVGFTVSGSVS